jgi:hypothetical protein
MSAQYPYDRGKVGSGVAVHEDARANGFRLGAITIGINVDALK